MDEMQQGIGAYGAGRAGGAFDLLTFIQQPHTGLRLVSWLFSLVIFGCVSNEGYINRPDEVKEFCIFNRNQNACNYAVGMGSLAFLSSMLFLALDVYFPQISSVKDRKKAVLADVGASAFWAFMWFVGFCLLANQWQVSKPDNNPLQEGGDAARAAIAFSFFSIFTWDYTDPSEDAAATVPYSSYSAGDDLESPGGTGSYQQSNEGVYDGSAGYQRQEY
ncbi:synaptogyrin-1-like isoform X2 [Triplophysa dalaica]|uniref:synaptogyrin-1-like isoform X2 n=1 Tax=Triplophysa dalaica TaxID=1582913 RepID=UPI0024DF5176|nr:synaptogyrin-1-like isoform X2 [Triplophysa dalaica]